MKISQKTIFEFLRYVLVGGVSALVDMAANYLMLYKIFNSDKNNTLYVVISVAVGFILGIIVNYVLSNLFVFITKEQKEKGKSVKSFLLYVLVGIIGFGLTELLTFLGTKLIGDEGIWYILLTCVVKGIVLIWNYLGRKIFVYRGE